MGEEERWLPVVGFENSHEVSSLGRVRSIARTVMRKNGSPYNITPRELKGGVNHSGYRYFVFSCGTHLFAHRMVLEAFVGPRPEGMFGCHSDGNPANNALHNLRWGTHSENMQDAVRHGTHSSTARTHCPWGHAHSVANNTAKGIRNGTRGCLACARASSYVFDNPELRADFQKIADRYYASIMRGARDG